MQESSLTTPEDRNLENKWRPNQSGIKLTESEVDNAMNALNNTSFTSKFPAIDRSYSDPVIYDQKIGLISFIPAKGSSPNENGVYGFAKLRGNYSTDVEASERAEHLIRNVDSYHQIFHCYVGRPFPITVSSKYSAETTEVDIKSEITKSISADIKEKKVEEKKTISDMKAREENLIKESKQEEEDPYERYITLCVKKAQLSWTYIEHFKKINEIQPIILKTRDELSELDKEFPDFKDKYFEKYMTARKEAGLSNVTDKEYKDNFIAFMVEDKQLPYLDFDQDLWRFKEE